MRIDANAPNKEIHSIQPAIPMVPSVLMCYLGSEASGFLAAENRVAEDS